MKADEFKAKLIERKAAQDKVKAEYKARENVKALTTAERLERIERLLGLDK